MINSTSTSATNDDIVSVIIPVYNGERFIRKAIQSALDQTYPAVQVVVVDDGSKDSSRNIVEEEFGDRVTLMVQKNGGLSNARNAGIRAAIGSYVAFLDADDWWDPRKVELQVHELKANPDAEAHYCRCILVDSVTGTTMESGVIDPDTLWPLLRWCNPGIPPSSVMVRMELLQRVGGFDESIRACEDWKLWFQVVRKSRFVMSHELLTYYLMSSEGLCGDAQFMYDTFLKILDTLLLDGLEGGSRGVWRRRIISFQAYKGCLTARAAGDKAKERAFVWTSLLAWPSPFWAPERFKAFAVTLLRS